MTVEQLEKKLQKAELDSLYLFHGEETYLLETMVKKIKRLFGELIPGINSITIDDTNLESLIPEMETPAFGYEKKLILVKDTGLFQKEGKRKNAVLADQKEKLAKYIPEHMETIKESLIVIFIEEHADKFKLYKLLDEHGVVVAFERQKPAQIIARLKAISKAYHVEVEDNTIRYLIECSGTSLQDLINEIRKLIEYAGENGTITKKEVDLLCVKKVESVIFDLTDNLGKKEIKQALEVLKNLIASKEPIQKIFITLYNHFKKLYLVKLAIKQNREITEALNLKPNQMFLTTKYKMQANYFEEQELKTIIQEMIQLDADYKIGWIDLNIGLESILCRYCSK